MSTPAYRRCAVLWIEHRHAVRFEFAALARGGTGVVDVLEWFAHAPHLPAPVQVDVDTLRALEAIGPGEWQPRGALAIDDTTLTCLLRAGLLLQQDADSAHARADARLRDQGWHGAAAVYHRASCTEGLDAVAVIAKAGMTTAASLADKLGPPPPATAPRDPQAATLPLAPVAHDAFDALLDARTCGRNFDPAGVVSAADFSRIMARVFGQRGRLRIADGFEVMKRTSPSGGGLHPTECHLIVQRVAGIAPGLYRYLPLEHALLPVTPGIVPPRPGDTGTRALPAQSPPPWDAASLEAFARIAVCGQHWFANAPVLCILAPRVARSFWKYRHHPRAYRVLLLDAGHLSQTLQLCAVQAGLASFITAAINEVDIERAYGLEGVVDGPVAICGFGPRAATMTQSELDPQRRVWPDAARNG